MSVCDGFPIWKCFCILCVVIIYIDYLQLIVNSLHENIYNWTCSRKCVIVNSLHE